MESLKKHSNYICLELAREEVIRAYNDSDPDAGFNAIDVIEKIPTANVIPVQWIENMIQRYSGMEPAMWAKLLRLWEAEYGHTC